MSLSNEDKTYNLNIQNTHSVYGTYTNRDLVYDGKFRVIQSNTEKARKTKDKRKKISGMAISSFKKDKLEALVTQLQIPLHVYTPTVTSTGSLDKKLLETIIERFLLDNSRVLKPLKQS